MRTNKQVTWPIGLLLALLVIGCGKETDEAASNSPLVNEPITFAPLFSESGKKSVASKQGANASGQFVHPFDNERFSGNILASIQASDPDGLAMVALSFNQNDTLKLLCEPGDDCPQGTFTKTETSINPANYGVFVGPLTLGLWVLDDLGNQMMVDSVTLDWQLRRIAGVTTVRSEDGLNIEVNWQNSPELLRYNLVLAAEDGVTTENYKSKAQGQARLAVSGGSQSFSNLNATQDYYLQLTGVDGSGESAFSSELRMAVPSGQVNTPPIVQQEVFSSPENQQLLGNVLINDSDNENDQLSVSPLPIQFPSNGDLELNRDGSFIYTPTPNFSGMDSFVYEVQDGQGGLSQGSVQISIDNINDPPTALGDAYATAQDQQLIVPGPGILQNDYDIDGDPIGLVLTPIENVQQGSLTIHADGGFEYTPNTGFMGVDYFVYQIQDDEGLSANARVDIVVGEANQPPVAVNDNYQIDEDNTLVVNASDANALLANDSDPENDPLSLTDNLIENVSNGMLTIDIAGNFTYIPNANFFGSDSFTYEIEDGQGNTAQAMAIISVNAINDAPIAVNDNYQVTANSLLSVAAPGVLGNDSDPDQDNLVVVTTPESLPSSGQLTLMANGSFDYQPNSDFTGQDSFEYRVIDPDQSFSVAQVTIDVLSMSLSLKGSSDSTSGLLTLEGIGETTSGSGIGQVRYTLGDCIQSTDTACTLTGSYIENNDSEHTPGAQGSFTMVYQYGGVGSTPTIAESISPGSNSVVFNDLGGAEFTLTLYPNTGGNIVASFPANGGSQMSFSAFLATNAVCTGLAPTQACNVGQVGLTPDAVISGNVATFDFTIDQPVLNINEPPVANSDTATVAEDTSINIDVLANDSDPDGDTLQVISASATNGTVAIESDFTLTYQASANYNGQDIIDYTIYDGQGHTASSTVDVTVTAVNDDPEPGDLSGLVNNSTTTMFIDVVAVATDVEMDNLSLVSAMSSEGNISIVDNLLYFDPNGVPANTQVVITYVLSDGNGGQTTGSLILIIANNWPIVVPDAYTTLPGARLDTDGQSNPTPLANDTDVNSADVLAYDQRLTAPVLGTIADIGQLESDFSYTPLVGSIGVDGSFYQVNDGQNQGEGLITIEISDIEWNNAISSPDIPVLDFLDLTFDGIDYALFNNSAVVETPSPSQGRYFAVSGRMIISSADKQSWQTEYAHYTGNLTAIASGYTLKNPGVETHIAVGNTGKILVHQTGGGSSSQWLELSTGIDSALNNIQFDGQRFMAPTSQLVAYSDNGYEWITALLNTSVEFRDIIFSNNMYVVVGDSGAIETSIDGNVWQVQNSSTTAQLNSIAFGSGTFVIVGNNGTILTSGDGINWTTRNSGLADNLNQVVWHDNQFVAVGNASKVLTSTDGTSWSQSVNIDTGNIRSVFSDRTELLIGSDNGELFTSADGQLFTPLQTNQDHLTSIANDGQNVQVRAGNPAIVQRSTDQGQNWSAVAGLGFQNINALEYYNGQFIAVGDNGLILLSSDGTSWNNADSGTNANLQDAFWFSGVSVQGTQFSLYVAVGDSGTILTSQDGISWIAEISSPSVNDDLMAVSHDDDYFVAVGNNGRLLVRNNTATPGATTWMDFFSNASWGNLSDIYYTGSKCVIVGDNSTIVTGTSQSVFSANSLTPALSLFAVDGNGNDVVTVGQDGIVFVSRDGGVTWRRSIQATELILRDLEIQASDNSIHAVGERGTFIKGVINSN